MRRLAIGTGWIVAIATAAAAPFVVLVVRALHTSWLATDDFSLIELHTRDVGGAHTPLLGPYSRFGWDHPGPALFFALAAPYRLLSSQSNGLLVGAAIVNAVAIVAVVVVLLRAPIPRLVAAFGLLVTVVLVHALSGSLLWSPWNPYVIVLPYFAFVMMSWWTGTGEDRALPITVAFASFVVQTHVSVAPEAIVLLAASLAWLFTAGRPQPEQARRRRSAFVALAVGVVMWSPPIVQQIQPHGGNLRLLWKFWTKSHHQTLGFTKASHLLAAQLSLPAPWITSHESFAVFTGELRTRAFPVPFALIVLAIATVVAVRRHDRVALVACTSAAIVVVTAWVSFARIIGPPYPYIIRWAWAAGAWCWFASAAALLPPLIERIGPRAETWVSRAVAIGAAVLLVVVTVGAFSAKVPNPRDSNAARMLVTAAAAQLKLLPAPILVNTAAGGGQDPSLAGGVIAGAVERGLDARYSSLAKSHAGPDRIVTPRQAASFVVIAVDDEIAKYERDPRYRVLAHYDSLTAAERRDFERMNAELDGVRRSDLAAFVASHRSFLNRLHGLSLRAIDAAVFVRLPSP